MTPADSSAPSPVALNRRTVDHNAIRRNIARIRDVTGVKLMAVVKADAFGHGAVDVARTALSAGAEWLGVATIEEALELRSAGISTPILAWLIDPKCALDAGVSNEITLSCLNAHTLRAIAEAATRLGKTAEVQLELDTGMARGGEAPDAWRELCLAAAEAERNGVVRVSGVWSHLANATDPNPSSVAKAVEDFDRGIEVALDAGLKPKERHLANSAGALEHPSTVGTLVRCAASIYGIETVVGRSHGLEYATRLLSRVIQLRKVPAGTGVGYGHEYVTTHETTLALVPIGYADGVPRLLGGKGEVVIGGARFPIVGSISMDQLVIDVGSAAVHLGDEVVLLGNAAEGEPDPAEWAHLVGVLPHDVLTSFSTRVERTAVNLT